MQILKSYSSPHFEDTIIPVEFVVIHYTAQSLKESLNIFLSPLSKVSCHLLIDRDGSTYELVDCWNGKVKKAFHAGQSVWKEREVKTWTSFNHFSIGIELVNWNGNLFPFESTQYKSLVNILTHFKSQYPQLRNPDRVLGHEHIAGFRGKKDPGYLFDWSFLFKQVYKDSVSVQEKEQDFSSHSHKQVYQDSVPVQEKEKEASLKKSQSFPIYSSVLTKKDIESLQFLKKGKRWNDKKAKRVSVILENKSYPFWFKKLLLFFYHLFF